ncbi:hypothetical protein D049_1566A, partial [Vibrio parahaemolyticus VPTS-2010]
MPLSPSNPALKQRSTHRQVCDWPHS